MKAIIIAILRAVAYVVLRLRYDIRIVGLDAVRARGRRGILFLPNHPALIDPVIVVSTLMGAFAPRTLADADAVGAPGIRHLMELIGARVFPGMAKHADVAQAAIARVMAESVAGMRAGENLLLYPAGHLMREPRESVGASGAAETILRGAPEARVVLVRTRGLWGSSFSNAPAGREPDIVQRLLRGLGIILLNGIFFTPRRTVTLEFVEPDDLPRTADRGVINRYLEAFYNVEPLPRNTCVPYYWWQGSRPVELPEPTRRQLTGDAALVPAGTREVVLAHLREISGVRDIRDEARLEHDLSLDSLARAELLAWLEGEFGHAQGNVDSLETVADVLLSASGESVAAGDQYVYTPPAPRFFEGGVPGPLYIPEGDTVAAVFLRQAGLHPDMPIIADQTSGVKTYRDLITGVLALRPAIEALPGEAVGIMLPASVAANVVYLATVFAGKTPVMVNWTVGVRNLQHVLRITGVQRVVTARKLLTRLKSQGINLDALGDCFVPLEQVAGGLSTFAKLRAALAARTNWGSLRRARIAPIAAVLSTSGSENLPKAVPLTHANLLTNLRDVVGVALVTGEDRLLGMLPPFHSFGLTANMLLALCSGLRTAYHANPTEGPLLARLVEAYRITLILGTPTFLYGILRAATNEQLASLRLAVTGAEECPPRVYEALAARAPQAMLVEGYGITEASPVVSLNDFHAPCPGAIGLLLPSLISTIVDVDTGQDVPPAATGMLLLRGPSIFPGYLGDAPSPFVEHNGHQWYRTGDLVSQAADGVMTFRGRLKRFVKIGGEMVSLPAVESVLQRALVQPTDEDGPTLAVIATEGDERPELVLVSTRPLDREEANRIIRDAGLSGLHNIRRVVLVEAIPTLGTGKTDYRGLQGVLTGCL